MTEPAGGLTHVDATGAARMVDVSDKSAGARRAGRCFRLRSRDEALTDFCREFVGSTQRHRHARRRPLSAPAQ